MMTFLVAALTVILVLNCLFLILLVLVQLPKKEAGMGMAFGGAATETLFGAGTGSVLTRATKYSAALFMSLSLILAIMNATMTRKAGAQLDEELQRLANPGNTPAMSAPATTNLETAPVTTLPTPEPAPTATQATSTATSTLLLSSTNTAPTPVAPDSTNAPAPPE